METEDDIPGAEQVERLAEALDKLIEYFSAEYNITLAAAIGCLHLKMHKLIQQAYEEDEDD